MLVMSCNTLQLLLLLLSTGPVPWYCRQLVWTSLLPPASGWPPGKPLPPVLPGYANHF